MRRIVNEVSKWTALQHRDARGLRSPTATDGALDAFGDEVFARLLDGEAEALPADERDAKLAPWADAAHAAMAALPAFQRLAQDARGDVLAAAVATDALLAEVQPPTAKEPNGKPPAGKPGQPAQADADALRRAVTRAVAAAGKAIDEAREAVEGLGWGRLPGTGSATGDALDAKSVRKIMTRLATNPTLKRIAKLAGRLKRIAATKRRERVENVPEQIVSVEVGGEIPRLLPAELANLVDDDRELDLLRRLAERQAMQYAMAGNEPKGRGPLVLCVDKSGSMSGRPDEWAAAVALVLADAAAREGRTFALICGDDTVKHCEVVRPGSPLPEEALLVGCGGGTDIAAWVFRALDLIGEHGAGLKGADVVLVTDGESSTERAAEYRERTKAAGISTLGLGIGTTREALAPWCDTVHAVASLDTLDDGAAEALFKE